MYIFEVFMSNGLPPTIFCNVELVAFSVISVWIGIDVATTTNRW